MEIETGQESSDDGRLLGDGRGQTNQDYIIGITFLLVSVLFVFGYVPGLYSSYADPVDGTEFTQADRAAEWLVENYSVDGKENVLEYHPNDDSVGIMELKDPPGSEFEAFRNETSINTTTNRRARPNVNVMIVNSSRLSAQQLSDPIVADGNRLEFGDDYENQSAATSKRVVDLNRTDRESKWGIEDENYCTPSCWLIVRIW